MSRFILMIAAAAPGLAEARKYAAMRSALSGSSPAPAVRISMLNECGDPQFLSMSSRTPLPALSTPCTWNTFLARSTPMVYGRPSPVIRCLTRPFWQVRCRERASSTTSFASVLGRLDVCAKSVLHSTSDVMVQSPGLVPKVARIQELHTMWLSPGVAAMTSSCSVILTPIQVLIPWQL